MTKRSRNILMIVAVTLFISAFLIDITSLGRHWDLFGRIDTKRMLLTLFIITVMGLLLGLFFFRKQPYIQRLSSTVSIAVILFSLLLIGNALTSEYGLFEAYNYFIAKRDVKHGKIQILTAGHSIEPLSEEELKVEDSIRKSLGFTIINIGIWSSGAEKYNNVMEVYLEEKNGRGWRDLLNRKMDSVLKERHLQN